MLLFLDCALPMNFTNGKLPKSAFKAKSHRAGHPAYQARFFEDLWCGSTMKDPSWLQVDLGKVLIRILIILPKQELCSLA